MADGSSLRSVPSLYAMLSYAYGAAFGLRPHTNSCFRYELSNLRFSTRNRRFPRLPSNKSKNKVFLVVEIQLETI